MGLFAGAQLPSLRTYTLVLDRSRTDVHSAAQEGQMNTPTQQIVIGVLAERATGERRFALIPSDIKKLILSAKFFIESGAGPEAGIDDNSDVEAGAWIADSRDILETCDIVVKVRRPGVDETPRAGRTLV